VGKASRDKGARGEREVAGVFRSHGIEADRTPNSGGLQTPGDLVGVEGFTIEVKRCNVWRVPEWIWQAYESAAAAPVASRPAVAFRRDRRAAYDPPADWHALVALDVLCELIAKTLA
jgi:hypothetical protein